MEGPSVEVRIGVQHAHRELMLESAQSSDEVQDTVAKALTGDDRLLVLVDDRGRRIVVPTDKLAFVEIGEEAPHRVGFGAASA
jgi:Protein of unknown function (DUF3107)